MHVFLNEQEARETVVSVLFPNQLITHLHLYLQSSLTEGKLMKRIRPSYREGYGGDDAGVKPGARKSVQATNSLNTTFCVPGTGASGGHVMMIE